MKRKILIPLFILTGFLLPGISAQGQHKTFIKFNPFTLPEELDVYVSREISPALTLEAGGGFIYTDYWDHLLNQVNFGQLIPHINEHQYLNAKGYAARLGLRFYVISPNENRKAAGTYFEPLLLFKQIWYPHKEDQINGTTYREKSIKYVSGLQLLIGRQHKWHSFYLDKYIGLGVKAKTYRFDDFQKDPDSGAVVDAGQRTTSWLPDVKLGIKIAFGLSGQ